jgi:hypothetical protein
MNKFSNMPHLWHHQEWGQSGYEKGVGAPYFFYQNRKIFLGASTSSGQKRIL